MLPGLASCHLVLFVKMFYRTLSKRITEAADAIECAGGCGYPMCSVSCGDVREHREFECAAFREKGYKVSYSIVTNLLT